MKLNRRDFIKFLGKATVASGVAVVSGLPGTKEDILEKYKELGINVLSEDPEDDLFYIVQVPKGWTIQPTDHPMWTNLVDDDNQPVARIFYKAAFYDRNAHIHFL